LRVGPDLHVPAGPLVLAGGRAGVGVAVGLVGQGEQCLPAGVQPPASGLALLAAASDAIGERLDNVDLLSYLEPRSHRAAVRFKGLHVFPQRI
jgi:hypothetical protein